MASRPVTVVATTFKGRKKDGDFKWMVKQPENDDALFIIAENYLDSVRDDASEGGGTACLRMLTPDRVADGVVPRAVGIPTGWSLQTRGFSQLDSLYVKTIIDLSLDRASIVLSQHPQIKRLIYSSDAADPLLVGVGIFGDTLCPNVRKYISDQIQKLPARQQNKRTLDQVRRAELRMLPFALLADADNTPASRAASSSAVGTLGIRGGRALRQQSLVTGAKRPFGMLS